MGQEGSGTEEDVWIMDGMKPSAAASPQKRKDISNLKNRKLLYSCSRSLDGGRNGGESEY